MGNVPGSPGKERSKLFGRENTAAAPGGADAR